MSFTYTEELEHLILDTLLPVYNQWSKMTKTPVPKINDKLLSKIVAKKKVAALLRPKEILS